MKNRSLCSQPLFSPFFQYLKAKIKKLHKKTLCKFQKSKMKCENTKKVNLLHTSRYFQFFSLIIILLVCRQLTTSHYIGVSLICVYGQVSREFYLHKNLIKRSSHFPKSKNRVVHSSVSRDDLLDRIPFLCFIVQIYIFTNRSDYFTRFLFVVLYLRHGIEYQTGHP